MEYFGHVIKGEKYHLPQLILHVKIERRRDPRRGCILWLRNLRQWSGLTTTAKNIITWASLISQHPLKIVTWRRRLN